MAGEIVAYVKAAGVVADTLRKFLAAYRVTKAKDAAMWARLQVEVEEAKSIATAYSLHHITIVQVDAIASVQRAIDHHALTGPALTYQMEQLQLLNQRLLRNLGEFSA